LPQGAGKGRFSRLCQFRGLEDGPSRTRRGGPKQGIAAKPIAQPGLPVELFDQSAAVTRFGAPRLGAAKGLAMEQFATQKPESVAIVDIVPCGQNVNGETNFSGAF
jgi:hypothetical protein